MKRTILILIALLSAFPVFAGEPPECIVKAREDFSIELGDVGTVDVKRGEQYLGKIYGNYAKIKHRGIWLKVSRNQVTTIGVDPTVPISGK